MVVGIQEQRDRHKLIGERIRDFRQDRELSQQQVARLCYMSVRVYGKIERGEINYRLAELQAIAKALRFDVRELL